MGNNNNNNRNNTNDANTFRRINSNSSINAEINSRTRGPPSPMASALRNMPGFQQMVPPPRQQHQQHNNNNFRNLNNINNVNDSNNRGNNFLPSLRHPVQPPLID